MHGALFHEQIGEAGQNILTALSTYISREQNPLLKYQLCLRLLGIANFNEGADPYQSMNAVRFLRNKFVHFKPTWAAESEETEWTKSFEVDFYFAKFLTFIRIDI